MIDLRDQILILLYSFLSGVMFGIGFDIYKLLILNSKNIFINFMKSSIFWIFLGVGVFKFLLYTQYATLSLYTYFYIFLGIIFYLKFISKNIFNKVKTFIYCVVSIFRLVFKNVYYLVIKIFNKKPNKSL